MYQGYRHNGESQLQRVVSLILFQQLQTIISYSNNNTSINFSLLSEHYIHWMNNLIYPLFQGIGLRGYKIQENNQSVPSTVSQTSIPVIKIQTTKNLGTVSNHIVKSNQSWTIPIIGTDLRFRAFLDASIKEMSFNFCKETLQNSELTKPKLIKKIRGLLQQTTNKEELTRKLLKIINIPFKARRIAHTESQKIINNSQLLYNSHIGTKYKVWKTSGDSCERCNRLDGRKKRINEPFLLRNESGSYDKILIPPLHPFCNCLIEWTN